MISGLFKKHKYIIYLSIGVIAITMIILAVKTPQPFLSAFIGFLGAVFGIAIIQFTQWSIFKQEEAAKFRLAAVDKRLEVHQKAYPLWLELLWSLSDDKKLKDAITKCQTFWRENCLYLDRRSRDSCFRAIYNANLLGLDRDHMKSEERAEMMEEIRKAVDHLEEGVGLPAIGEYEEIAPLEE